MNIGQTQPSPVAPTRTARLGLIAAALNASFVIKGKDGVDRQLEVRELRTRKKGAKDTTLVAKCFHPDCRAREWKSTKELLEDHPSTGIMTRQQETHVHYLAEVKDGETVALYTEE